MGDVSILPEALEDVPLHEEVEAGPAELLYVAAVVVEAHGVGAVGVIEGVGGVDIAAVEGLEGAAVAHELGRACGCEGGCAR